MSFPEPLPSPDPLATAAPPRDSVPPAPAASDRAAPNPAARARIHDLPLPVTWDLLGSLRRTVAPPLFDTLDAIHEEAVLRTMLCESLPADGRPQAAVERWIRRFAPLRREWLDVALEAVGDAGVTPLRVEAIAVTRAALRRLRVGSAARTDLEAALCDAGPILSAYGAARLAGRAPDPVALRRLSTRYDYCVTAALLAEADVIGPDMALAVPLLCAEARIAAARLRRLVEPAPAPAQRAPRPRRAPRGG